jgi:plastocyanin
MKRLAMAGAVLAVLVGAWATSQLIAVASGQGNDNNIAVLDDCDPADAAYNASGGCTLKPHEGDVTFAEFFALAFSPLGAGVLIGHPSWRIEPSYISTTEGKTIRVKNEGGRIHTFTEVAEFGGGRVPVLNGLLAVAPECVPTTEPDLAPGDRKNITGLDAGLHKYQCCIHPWMRAAVRVH